MLFVCSAYAGLEAFSDLGGKIYGQPNTLSLLVSCSYISFAELFVVESVEEFEEADFGHEEAYRYATLTFFGGMLFMWILDKLVG